MSETETERLILKHFDAHQRSYDVKKSRRMQGSIESRIAMLKNELESSALSSDLNRLSMEDPPVQADASNRLQDALVVTILRCINAAIVTELSNDAHESIDAILELASVTIISFGRPVAMAVLDRILHLTSVIADRIRVQACKLLGLCIQAIVLSSNLENEQQSDPWKAEFLDSAKDALICRLTDKNQAVRKAAIIACGAFDTTVYSDVICSLRWSINHDPSATNRSAAIASFPCTTADSIDHLIQRVRDSNIKVRVDAVDAIRTKTNVAYMTQEHFSQLIQNGLTDRCQHTHAGTVRLVCTSWIKAAKYDPIELIKLIGPIDHEQECEKIVGVLLDRNEIEMRKDLSDAEIHAFQQGISKIPTVISEDQSFEVTPEAALYARVQVSRSIDSKTLAASKKADILTKVVPDVPLLCESVEKLVRRLTEAIIIDDQDAEERDTFVCRQMLQLAQMTDLQEEGSRRHFAAAMKAMLSSVDTPDELLEDAIKAMAKTYNQEEDHLLAIINIVDDMANGEAVSYSEVAEFTQLRIISILSVALENTSMDMAMHPILHGVSSYITLAVTSTDALVRECGVSCLGRLALLSDEPTVLLEYKPLLLKVASTEDETMEIRAQALLALCDLSLLFEDILVPEPASLVSLVTILLQHCQAGVVAVAAEVAAKLLFSGKIRDFALLAGMLVAFFNKSFTDLAKEEDDNILEVGSLFRMQQILSVFFPAYSLKSTEGKDSLISSIGPMLELVSGKKTKQGATWNTSKMIHYIVSTVEVEKEEVDLLEEGKGADVPKASATLAACVEVSYFLIHNSDNLTETHLRALCRFLGGADIDIEADHTKTILAFKSNVNELSMLITDENSQHSLETVAELLEEFGGISEYEGDESGEDDNESESTEASLVDTFGQVEIAEDKENSVQKGKVESRISTGARLSLASIN